jgi:hypothetical protein
LATVNPFNNHHLIGDRQGGQGGGVRALAHNVGLIGD